MVFVVRGLFNSLEFLYAQFPCAEVSGELLYDPFWEAVQRVENCGLKVHYVSIVGLVECLLIFYSFRWLGRHWMGILSTDG